MDAASTRRSRMRVRVYPSLTAHDRDAFIKNKRATGRARDLGDIEALGE